MKSVYLAGPFFNRKQLRLVKTFETILRNKGLKVYSPREHQSKFGQVQEANLSL